MTRERIKDFKEIVLPFFTNYLLKENYENLGKSDAEEFEKDFSEIIELADKALEQQPCEDTISRQAAIDAVKKNTFRLTFAEEQNCEGHVAWSAEAVYSDVMEGALLDLPSAQPEQQIPQMRGWVCPVCGRGLSPYTSVCPCNNGKGWEITC